MANLILTFQEKQKKPNSICKTMDEDIEKPRGTNKVFSEEEQTREWKRKRKFMTMEKIV